MRLAILSLSVLLSACATPARLHNVAELNSVGRSCGLALGELIQDEEEKRLLFLFRVAPTREERQCVQRWARKNRLRPVFIDAINEPGS